MQKMKKRKKRIERCGGGVVAVEQVCELGRSLVIIGVAVEVKTMFAYDISEWQDVKDEKERTKHRTLGDAL